MKHLYEVSVSYHKLHELNKQLEEVNTTYGLNYFNTYQSVYDMGMELDEMKEMTPDKALQKIKEVGGELLYGVKINEGFYFNDDWITVNEPLD